MNRETGLDMDADLVLKFRNGEESAFEDLVRRHMREAYGFCLRLTGDPAEADELSQDGFVLAYRHLKEFRGESTFLSWLFRILLNRHRDRIRGRRREEARRAGWRRQEERRGAGGGEGGEDLQAEELSEVIRKRVQDLPDRQREVLVLHVYQGLDYREIAELLGCTYDDVKVNLSLARRRLREELREHLT
jgi:RNA polymerase sigma-70 factor (ECF subfamily)